MRACNLHAHSLVWIAGAPKTPRELFSKLIEDSSFGYVVSEYAKAVITEQLHLSWPASCGQPSGEDGSPRNSCDFVPLHPARPSQPLSSSVREPYMFQCSSCGYRFRRTDFLEQQIRRQAPPGQQL